MNPLNIKPKQVIKGFFISFLLLYFTISVIAQQNPMLVKYESNGKFGFIDSLTREVVIPAQYDHVSRFREGTTIVTKNKLSGIIDLKGNEIVPIKFDIVFAFVEGMVFVMKDKKYGFYDSVGNAIVPLVYDKVHVYKDGLASVKQNKKWGFINNKGTVVIPIKYDNCDEYVHEGMISVNLGGKGDYFWDFKGGKWGFVDKTGKVVIPLIYDKVESFNNGAAYVTLDDKKFFIDKKGNKIDSIRYGDNAKSGQYKNIRGCKMYYETYGKGEPLLLIHGNGGSIVDMRYQIHHFAKSYKVIAVDSRAQGKSIDNSDSLSYEMMAEDFNTLLDSLHLDSCNVIGWSDGGINGLLLAFAHPDKVKKLAITGANLWPDTTAVDPFIYNGALKEAEELKNVSKSIAAFRNIYKVKRLLPYQPHIPVENLSWIECPVLVIGGDHDVILTKHTLLIAESIPKSYLWIIPNSGHSTPITHKEEFNREVDTFFKTPYRKIEGNSKFN